jgi:hypothetical protein
MVDGNKMNKDNVRELVEKFTESLIEIITEDSKGLEEKSKPNIFENSLYWVWDHKIKPELPPFRSTSPSYGVEDLLKTWNNCEVVYPQWIDVPDDLREEPDIKGSIVVELQDGDQLLRDSVSQLGWDNSVIPSERTKRICILESQEG